MVTRTTLNKVLFFAVALMLVFGAVTFAVPATAANASGNCPSVWGDPHIGQMEKSLLEACRVP